MTYTDVINTTETEITIRPPWNQGDCHVVAPGDSMPCPETWLPWAARRGLVSMVDLEAAWQESGLEAARQEEALAASELDEAKEESDRPLEGAGILFDSKPSAPKKGQR